MSDRRANDAEPIYVVGKLSRAAGVFRWLRGATAWDVVRIVLGVLLITAALLKAHQLLSDPLLERSVFTSRWFLICVAQFELLLGLWLLLGIWPRQAWWAALGCFSLFTAVSLWKGLAGEATCGCFGSVPVNPWYTFLIDLCAIAALIQTAVGSGELTRSGDQVGTRNGNVSNCAWRFPVRLIAGLALWTLFAVGSAVAMWPWAPGTVDSANDLIPDGAIMVVAPSEDWIGKAMPLLRYIDVAGQLRVGRWWIVMVRHGCPRCDALLEHLSADPRGPAEPPPRWRLAIIEVPPYGLEDEQLSKLRRGGLLAGEAGTCLKEGKLCSDDRGMCYRFAASSCWRHWFILGWEFWY